MSAIANKIVGVVCLSLYLLSSLVAARSVASEPLPKVSITAQSTAAYALERYGDDTISALAKLIPFKTIAREGLTPDTDAEFVGFKLALAQLALQLGLDFDDRGYVVLIGLGEAEQKLGVITHGDVQPADAAFWHQDPFKLDMQSQPGLMIGRGTEDDKGPIVTAMYAMKAIKDKGLILNRRIELMVYMAEESDWDPLREFLKTYTPADINITIDAEYPVVTAEKGWSEIRFVIPAMATSVDSGVPALVAFNGGAFASQVPQQAQAELRNTDEALLRDLQRQAKLQPRMSYQFTREGDRLHITAMGKSTHSSTPEEGVNAVTHLAALLDNFEWPASEARLTQQFISQMVGLGLYAEQFGNIAYRDDFMGPMTMAATLIEPADSGTLVVLNLRRPQGKGAEQLDAQAHQALAQWQKAHQVSLQQIETYWGQPKVMDKAPHLNTLLSVFGHFTDTASPQPVSIGGSTNSKLFPNALSFGPAMPGVEYTGHSEHEYISQAQFMLNLKMYTAALVELAAKQPSGKRLTEAAE